VQQVTVKDLIVEQIQRYGIDDRSTLISELILWMFNVSSIKSLVRFLAVAKSLGLKKSMLWFEFSLR